MFCRCSMPLSIVGKASNSCCANASNSPFAFSAHPRWRTVIACVSGENNVRSLLGIISSSSKHMLRRVVGHLQIRDSLLPLYPEESANIA